MAVRMDSLKPGDSVRLKFHGSKQFGNDPYELDTAFVELKGAVEEDGTDNRRAVFEDVEAYRSKGHWAYGSGAMKLSIKERL